MMSGGLFMMGFGLIAMLLVVAIPIILIGVLVWALTRHPSPVVPTPNAPVTAGIPGNFCSHCGAGLQSGWSHCPQCGAPIGAGVNK